MLDVFLNVISPVILIVALGAIIGRWRTLRGAAISSIVFYLFSPALIFDSLAKTKLSADVAISVIVVMVVVYVVTYAVSTAWSMARRHDGAMKAGFALGATTPNSGNMGLPVAQLAFGDVGFQIAILNMVAGVVLAYSFGIVVASMAGGSTRRALVAPFRFPLVYAAAAGIVVNLMSIDLPVPIEVPLTSMASAAIPCMLVMLGMQLQVAVSNDLFTDTLVVNVIRLLLAPVAAVLACIALGTDGVTRDTIVVLTAMPTAVTATLIATEFRTQPSFVTRTVVTTTIVSSASLSVLIAFVT